MNERIKELVVESGNGQFHNGKFYPHIGSRTAKDWEKFAELIVGECTRIVVNNGIATATHDQMVRQDCVNEIKEHFGVEESKGWVCPKCGTDRTKQECPKGYTAALTGECPMIGEAQ